MNGLLLFLFFPVLLMVLIAVNGGLPAGPGMIPGYIAPLVALSVFFWGLYIYRKAPRHCVLVMKMAYQSTE
jgi:hypothetical protein